METPIGSMNKENASPHACRGKIGCTDDRLRAISPDRAPASVTVEKLHDIIRFLQSLECRLLRSSMSTKKRATAGSSQHRLDHPVLSQDMRTSLSLVSEHIPTCAFTSATTPSPSGPLSIRKSDRSHIDTDVVEQDFLRLLSMSEDESDIPESSSPSLQGSPLPNTLNSTPIPTPFSTTPRQIRAQQVFAAALQCSPIDASPPQLTPCPSQPPPPFSLPDQGCSLAVAAHQTSPPQPDSPKCSPPVPLRFLASPLPTESRFQPSTVRKLLRFSLSATSPKINQQIPLEAESPWRVSEEHASTCTAESPACTKAGAEATDRSRVQETGGAKDISRFSVPGYTFLCDSFLSPVVVKLDPSKYKSEEDTRSAETSLAHACLPRQSDEGSRADDQSPLLDHLDRTASTHAGDTECLSPGQPGEGGYVSSGSTNDCDFHHQDPIVSRHDNPAQVESLSKSCSMEWSLQSQAFRAAQAVSMGPSFSHRRAAGNAWSPDIDFTAKESQQQMLSPYSSSWLQLRDRPIPYHKKVGLRPQAKLRITNLGDGNRSERDAMSGFQVPRQRPPRKSNSSRFIETPVINRRTADFRLSSKKGRPREGNPQQAASSGGKSNSPQCERQSIRRTSSSILGSITPMGPRTPGSYWDADHTAGTEKCATSSSTLTIHRMYRRPSTVVDTGTASSEALVQRRSGREESCAAANSSAAADCYTCEAGSSNHDSSSSLDLSMEEYRSLGPSKRKAPNNSPVPSYATCSPPNTPPNWCPVSPACSPDNQSVAPNTPDDFSPSRKTTKPLTLTGNAPGGNSHLSLVTSPESSSPLTEVSSPASNSSPDQSARDRDAINARVIETVRSRSRNSSRPSRVNSNTSRRSARIAKLAVVAKHEPGVGIGSKPGLDSGTSTHNKTSRRRRRIKR